MKNYWKKFQEFYFRTHNFEKSGRIYRALGAHIYSKYIHTSGSYWIRKGAALPMIIRGPHSRKEGLEFYAERLSIGLEKIHAFKAFPISTTITFLNITNPYWVALFTGINVIGNFYPVISLRYNRNRARNLLDRLNE